MNKVLLSTIIVFSLFVSAATASQKKPTTGPADSQPSKAATASTTPMPATSVSKTEDMSGRILSINDTTLVLSTEMGNQKNETIRQETY